MDARAARERARERALRAAERAASLAYLAQLDALVAVHDAAGRDLAAVGQSGALEDAQMVEEACLVVHLHRNTLARRLFEADAILDFPVLRALLVSGGLGVRHAVAAIEEVTSYNDPGLAERVLHTVLLTGTPGWQDTPTRLVLALQRCVQQLDPAGCALRRAERQHQHTGVRLRALTDGLAQLTATGNALTVKAAHTLLAHLAEQTGPDDDRTRGQRQLDALCDALVQAAGTAVPVELHLEIPTQRPGHTPPPAPAHPACHRS